MLIDPQTTAAVLRLLGAGLGVLSALVTLASVVLAARVP
jgi:hypothetical protein